MLFVAVAVTIVCLMATFLIGRSRSAVTARRDACRVIVVDGEEHELSSVVWALAAYGDPARVVAALIGRGLYSRRELEATVVRLVDEMAEADRVQFRVRCEKAERAAAEHGLWVAQTEALTVSMAAGAADAFIVTLGENADWLKTALMSSLDDADVSALATHALIGRAASNGERGP